MTHVVENDDLWAKDAKGINEGTPGRDLFKQRAAKLLSSMNYSIMFTSSRIGDDGEISNGTLSLKSETENLITVPNYDGAIIVDDDKIQNIYNADGSINNETLCLCFAKLEITPIVVTKNSKMTSLHERFHATTGRDRLLDFMASKTREAHEPQYKEWRRKARENMREALQKEAQQKKMLANRKAETVNDAAPA